MARRRRIAEYVALGIGCIALIAVAAVLVLTQTDWGRERVRGIVLGQLENVVNGDLRIGRIEGNLLRGVRLVDVSIEDEEGRPFLRADTLGTRFSLRGLLRQRVILADLRLVRPVIVLDQPPGEEWNWVRIFGIEPDTAVVEPDRRGWGSWVELSDLTMVDGSITVRTEWKPADDLTPAEAARALERARSDETRDNVVAVAGGHQNVMEFRTLDAVLPRVRIAHPDSVGIPIDVARFSGIVQPWRPPAADVRDMSGAFLLVNDSLLFRDVAARLPESRLAANGAYALDSGEMLLELDAPAVAFADLRWLYPPLPEEGGGSLRLTLQAKPLATRAIAEKMDLRIGGGTLRGRADVTTGDTLRLGPTDLAFDGIDTRALVRLAPDATLPRHGTLTGRIAADGTLGALRVDGDVTFADHGGTGSSRALASGEIGFGDQTRFRALDIELRPLQADLVRAFAPDLPLRGTIVGTATLSGRAGDGPGELRLDADMTLRDPQTGVSRVLADGGVRTGDALLLRALRLHFDPLRLDLLRPYAPDLPAGAVLAGRATLDGDPTRALVIDADLSIDEPRSGTSRIAAAGGVRFGDALVLDRLAVRLAPLRVALLHAFAPDLPIGGTLAGTATLNGNPAARLGVVADLVHEEADARSAVAASGTVVTGGTGVTDLRLALRPLSLVTVGRFAPGAGLYGSVTGNVHARGTLADLRLDGDLRVADSGTVRIDAALDLAGATPGYDLRLAMQGFDIAALSTRAPAATDLTGTIAAVGRGFEPATMRATLEADLAGSAVDDIAADVVRVSAAVQDGLATVDAATVRVGTAVAEANGAFGLVAGRAGTLSYRVEIDSLAAFAAADTLPGAAVDTAQIATAGLAGRLSAAGTLRGNVALFDADGEAEVEELNVGDTYVGTGTATYRLAGIGGTQPEVTLDAAVRDLRAGGMAFDSASVQGEYAGDRFGAGRARLAAYQNDATDLSADVEFTLSLERSELRLADAVLRFDTVTWRTVTPGTVSWGEAGVEVSAIELLGSDGGRIRADGRLPVDGQADLELRLDAVEVGPFASLLQLDAAPTGRLDLDARLEGTQAAPRLTGELTATDARLDGRALPDVRATLSYADRALTAQATLTQDGIRLATADAALPIDLALTGVSGSRLLPGELAIEVVADSLPVEALPALTDDVEDVSGRIRGNVAVRGTWETPLLDGVVDLDLGTMRVVPLGVRFRDIGGTLRLAGREVVLDSLVAWSGGPVRIDGVVTLETLTEPAFDLAIAARNSRVIDNDDVRLNIDADIAIGGTLEALVVEGDIRTRSGVIYIPTLDEMGSTSVVSLDDPVALDQLDERIREERDRLLATSPLLENLQVDVAVIIDRDVWLRSTEANVEIYTPPDVGALRIRINPLALEGTIITDRGEYEFMGRRFRLSRGTVTFTGETEFNPLLQVAAEHEVRLPGREAFQIRVLLDGRMQDLSIALESSAQPPISQTDLLSYVAFGRDASSLLSAQGSALSGQGTGSGALVGNVAGLATQQLAAVALEQVVNQIETSAMRSLGVDVFRVTPADLPPELFTGRWVDVVRGTEVEAGRYVSPRLFVGGQARLALARPGMRVEYWTPQGFQWRTSWQPRFITLEPTLGEREPRRASVFGMFLFREWRF
jgi:translocation and assembly module TamB